MYLLLVSAYCECHDISTSDTFFSNNNISISVKRSNFTLAFFKAVCHANLGVERKCV